MTINTPNVDLCRRQWKQWKSVQHNVSANETREADRDQVTAEEMESADAAMQEEELSAEQLSQLLRLELCCLYACVPTAAA